MTRRNREINIFNMSLLDILCGALGAFCFMMLTLLPYYMPSGNTAETRARDRERDKEFGEAIKDIEKIKDMVDAETARKLEEELKRLRQLYDEAVGQLNAARAELAEKTALLEKAQADLAQAVAQRDQAEQARQKAEAERDEAARKLRDAEEAKQKAEAALARAEAERDEANKRAQAAEQARQKAEAERDEATKKQQAAEQGRQKAEGAASEARARGLGLVGWHVVNVYSDHMDQELAIYLEEEKDGKTVTPPFDPRVAQGGTVFSIPKVARIVAVNQAFKPEPGKRYKLYLSQYGLTQKPGSEPHGLTGYVTGADFVQQLPRTEVTPERPWVLVGTMALDAAGKKLEFRPATPEEREPDWQAVNDRIRGQPIPEGKRVGPVEGAGGGE
jgi:hypothetical protein